MWTRIPDVIEGREPPEGEMVVAAYDPTADLTLRARSWACGSAG